MVRLLPHIAEVCREAREEAGGRITGIADAAGYEATTSISRFEKARAWPRDPDNVLAAYADSTGVSVFDLWDEAVRRGRAASSPAADDETEIPPRELLRRLEDRREEGRRQQQRGGQTGSA